jgi:hypothetical protein
MVFAAVALGVMILAESASKRGYDYRTIAP